jgi:GNAT superfamily N-acetyltransferase
MSFHPEGVGRGKTAAQNRSEKECRVREGNAHAALVYDGGTCVGWCQFGAPDELPRIKHRRVYQEGLTHLPHWRITCFFVDKGCRGQGVAVAALRGALQEIARLGGGTVESYPEHVAGRSVSASFLHNGTTVDVRGGGIRAGASDRQEPLGGRQGGVGNAWAGRRPERASTMTSVAEHYAKHLARSMSGWPAVPRLRCRRAPTRSRRWTCRSRVDPWSWTSAPDSACIPLRSRDEARE